MIDSDKSSGPSYNTDWFRSYRIETEAVLKNLRSLEPWLANMQDVSTQLNASFNQIYDHYSRSFNLQPSVRSFSWWDDMLPTTIKFGSKVVPHGSSVLQEDASRTFMARAHLEAIRDLHELPALIAEIQMTVRNSREAAHRLQADQHTEDDFRGRQDEVLAGYVASVVEIKKQQMVHTAQLRNICQRIRGIARSYRNARDDRMALVEAETSGQQLDISTASQEALDTEIARAWQELTDPTRLANLTVSRFDERAAYLRALYSYLLDQTFEQSLKTMLERTEWLKN